jgi:glycosyltransferase involved in cell wall biosynthesis
VRRKRERGHTISLALPALNEAETVGHVISTLKRALMDEVPLLDEIVLIDSNSTDATREIAASLGIPVYIHQHILADEVGSFPGKGEGLWKSLYVTRGDIIAWVDTDIVNIHPRFVYGILGPLLRWDTIQYVKGFYRRPIRIDGVLRAGGRRARDRTGGPPPTQPVLPRAVGHHPAAFGRICRAAGGVGAIALLQRLRRGDRVAH